MLGGELVGEILALRERGESTRRIAQELAVDRKTVRRWLRIGGWQPRQSPVRPRVIDRYASFIEQRGPEVGWNGVVLLRELKSLGFGGSYQQVQRFLKEFIEPEVDEPTGLAANHRGSVPMIGHTIRPRTCPP
jgi:transposase